MPQVRSGKDKRGLQMSDSYFDALRACGEYPRKGYGLQTEAEKREEIARKITKGWRDPWVLKEAARFGIAAPTQQQEDDDGRAEFEAWVTNEYGIPTDRYPLGGYVRPELNMWWASWKASRIARKQKKGG